MNLLSSLTPFFILSFGCWSKVYTFLKIKRKVICCLESVLNLHFPSIYSLAFPLLSLANNRIISNLKTEISSHLPHQSHSFSMLLSKGLQTRLGLGCGFGLESPKSMRRVFTYKHLHTKHYLFYRWLLQYHIVMGLWSHIEMSDKTTTLTQINFRGLLIQVIRLQLAGIRQSDHKPSA